MTVISLNTTSLLTRINIFTVFWLSEVYHLTRFDQTSVLVRNFIFHISMHMKFDKQMIIYYVEKCPHSNKLKKYLFKFVMYSVLFRVVDGMKNQKHLEFPLGMWMFLYKLFKTLWVFVAFILADSGIWFIEYGINFK